MVPIFDNGHGGVIAGNYQTPGKRSPMWERGVLYEGAFNRWVVNRLIEKMDRAGLKYYHVSPELTDVPLKTRVDRANEIFKNDKNVYYLSIHANAGGGEGIEGFTSPGKTKSDSICEEFLKRLEKDFEGISKLRSDLSDGDHDKEEKFFVLIKTNCPAMLIECGFMDNESDYFRLWSKDYLEKLVDSLFDTIEKLHKIV